VRIVLWKRIAAIKKIDFKCSHALLANDSRLVCIINRRKQRRRKRGRRGMDVTRANEYEKSVIGVGKQSR